MTFETLMLRSLFAASLFVFGLIASAMLHDPAEAVHLATHGGLGTALLAAPSSCTLPADGLVCPRLDG